MQHIVTGFSNLACTVEVIVRIIMSIRSNRADNPVCHRVHCIVRTDKDSSRAHRTNNLNLLKPLHCVSLTINMETALVLGNRISSVQLILTHMDSLRTRQCFILHPFHGLIQVAEKSQ